MLKRYFSSSVKSNNNIFSNFPKERVMEINGVPTASVPDLRIKFNRDGMTVIGVVEVF